MPTFFRRHKHSACIAIQNYVYYGEEIWLEVEEIYNPKDRKTEIKNRCKVKKVTYVVIYCPVSAGQELA